MAEIPVGRCFFLTPPPPALIQPFWGAAIEITHGTLLGRHYPQLRGITSDFYSKPDFYADRTSKRLTQGPGLDSPSA